MQTKGRFQDDYAIDKMLNDLSMIKKFEWCVSIVNAVKKLKYNTIMNVIVTSGIPYHWLKRRTVCNVVGLHQEYDAILLYVIQHCKGWILLQFWNLIVAVKPSLNEFIFFLQTFQGLTPYTCLDA